jgi:hypothetical protein
VVVVMAGMVATVLQEQPILAVVVVAVANHKMLEALMLVVLVVLA